MNTKKLLAALAAVVILAGGGYWWTQRKDATVPSVEDTVVIEETPVEPEDVSAAVPSIIISDDGTMVTYQGEEGKTALALLQELTTVTTQSSDYGDFVTGINGREADSSTEYWSFYVNGEYAQEGAGTYPMKSDDVIEWRLETL